MFPTTWRVVPWSHDGENSVAQRRLVERSLSQPPRSFRAYLDSTASDSHLATHVRWRIGFAAAAVHVDRYFVTEHWSKVVVGCGREYLEHQVVGSARRPPIPDDEILLASGKDIVCFDSFDASPRPVVQTLTSSACTRAFNPADGNSPTNPADPFEARIAQNVRGIWEVSSRVEPRPHGAGPEATRLRIEVGQQRLLNGQRNKSTVRVTKSDDDAIDPSALEFVADAGSKAKT